MCSCVLTEGSCTGFGSCDNIIITSLDTVHLIPVLLPTSTDEYGVESQSLILLTFSKVLGDRTDIEHTDRTDT